MSEAPGPLPSRTPVGPQQPPGGWAEPGGWSPTEPGPGAGHEAAVDYAGATSVATTGLSPRPPRQRQPGMPVYGDLLGPAPDPHPGADRQPGGSDTHGPHLESAPAAGAGSGPGGAAGGSGGLDGDPPGEGEAGPGKSGPSTGVIVGLVLIGATLLVLGALSIPFLLQHLRSPVTTGYSVGDCVVQDGLDARPADCGDPGAYEIVSQVDTRDDCPDPTQPAIEVEGAGSRFYCLSPAGAADAPAGSEEGSDSDADSAGEPDGEEDADA